MTMRSMPPASSHLAERPVPAPPPMIGWPASTIARNFFRISARGMAGMVHLRAGAISRQAATSASAKAGR